MLGNIYKGKNVLLTGHTGFKGSWLALWLTHLGCNVTGLSLDPQSAPNHWDLITPDITDHRIDIRDHNAISTVIQKSAPDIVFHLAAQSLVRKSYNTPLETWDTNVMGTANILQACRDSSALKAIIITTTDKCYENKEKPHGYTEDDRLGGHDPYSASKAATELLINSYRLSFFSSPQTPLLASARAGNVIGGGDWAEDRLMPEIMRASHKKMPLTMRSPHSIRPWQHVLEPLHGYLKLGAELLQGNRAMAEPWNFGPREKDACTVREIAQHIHQKWPAFSWHENPDPNQPHETKMLHLNSTKAHNKLQWNQTLSFHEQLDWTIEWYKDFFENKQVNSLSQIKSFMERIA